MSRTASHVELGTDRNESPAGGAYQHMAFTLAPDAALLKPIRVGDIEARNRIFMAPLTRSRAQDDGTPRALLLCELAAAGYRQTAWHWIEGRSVYLAVFEPPSEPPAPGAIRPCQP